MEIKSDIRDIGNRNMGTARTYHATNGPKCENRDSSVGIMTTLQAVSHRNLSSIPGKGKIFTAQLL